MFRTKKQNIIVIDPRKGFLTDEMIDKLPASKFNEEVEQIALLLPTLLKNKLIRQTVNNWDNNFPNEMLLVNNAKERQYALLMLNFISQGYIRETPHEPANVLPTVLSRNIFSLCANERPLTITYSDYILSNWNSFDPNQPLTPENIIPISTLTNSPEEKWFIQSHVAVEAACGKALYAAQKACLLKKLDNSTMLELINQIAESLDDAAKIFLRLKERCPSVFFWKILRPHFEGWDQVNGLTDTGGQIKGVKLSGLQEKYYVYAGVSGAQSPVMLAIDNALGIRHPTITSANKFLPYMLAEHRYFAEKLEENSILTNISNRNCNSLINAWENAREKLKLFRVAHLSLVETYIKQEAKKDNLSIVPYSFLGTGGTTIGEYLEERLDNTIKVKAKL